MTFGILHLDHLLACISVAVAVAEGLKIGLASTVQ
jgi:hypothetical protein